MKLPNDAPIVAVPMCVKHIAGQNFHTVGEKYLTAVIEGAGAYPLSFPALGPVLDPAALLDHVDGVLFTGSSSIRLWNLSKSFPELKPRNTGFGDINDHHVTTPAQVERACPHAGFHRVRQSFLDFPPRSPLHVRLYHTWLFEKPLGRLTPAP